MTAGLDPTPVGKGTSAGPMPAARGGALTRTAAALVIVALALTSLVFALQWRSARSDTDDRAAAAAAAGRFAERFLTLDSRNPQRTERAVVALATGAFRRTFRQGFEAGLVPALLAVGQVTTDATVKEVFVGDLDDRSAHVIVHVGVVAHPADQPKVVSNRPDSWVELDLVKQKGHWLVDGVGDLKLGSDAGPPPATPSTTAPGGAPAATATSGP